MLGHQALRKNNPRSFCGVWVLLKRAKAFGSIVKIKGYGGNVGEGTGSWYGETLGESGAGNVPTVSPWQNVFGYELEVSARACLATKSCI